MATQNLPFVLKMNSGGAYTPFTLQPGQVSSFAMKFTIDATTFVDDATARVIGAVLTGTRLSSETSYSFPYFLKSNASLGQIDFTISATGANTFAATEHINTFTFTVSSPWLSGNGTNGSSVCSVPMDFSISPMVCSFNVVFSTANVSPSGVTNFTATAVGNEAVGLTWTNPTATGLSAIKLVYKKSAIPSSISDGTVVKLASSVSSKTVEGLTAENGELYGFAIYTIDTDQQVSTKVSTSACPLWQPGNRAWPSHAEHIRMRNLGYI